MLNAFSAASSPSPMLFDGRRPCVSNVRSVAQLLWKRPSLSEATMKSSTTMPTFGARNPFERQQTAVQRCRPCTKLLRRRVGMELVERFHHLQIFETQMNPKVVGAEASILGVELFVVMLEDYAFPRKQGVQNDASSV